MPSTNQSGTSAGSKYDSDPKRILSEKNDLTIAAVIRGIRKPDRAQSYIDAELAVADDEGRDARKKIIAACNRKKAALDERDG